ncbi:phospholipase D-like domain-containing protein [Lacinutrix iliipiscaria]|uniref:Phospholipase D-like domain-containing protein n=1 Tax=Lacinutrix iliipiscaria TaxID=1230532 RepID=A0ABW5WS43_9FLAO
MSNKFFTLPDNDVSRAIETSASGSFVSKYLAAHYQKVASVKKDIKRLPESEEFFFLQSDNSFNAFTFIPVVLEHQTAKHLMATTYSINKRVINALVELHRNGLVDRITLLVSDTMLRRNPVITDLLASVNREYANINVLFAWVHAKVCLIETKEAHYVIEGSGNWSDNAYYEQYTFANCAKLFAFREKLFTDVQIRHKAINGEIIKL